MESFGTILLGTAFFIVFVFLVKKVIDYVKWSSKLNTFPKMNSPPIIKDFYHFSAIRNSPEKFHQSQFKKFGWLTVWASYYPVIMVFKSKPAHIILGKTSFLDRGWCIRKACSKYENLISMAGRRWKNRRTIINPSFSLDVIQSFVTTVVQHAESLIEEIKLKGDRSVDFHDIIIDDSLSLALDTSICLEKSSNWPGKKIIQSKLKEWLTFQVDRIGKPYLWIDILNDIRLFLRGKRNLLEDCKSPIDEVIKARMQNSVSDSYSDTGKKQRKPFLALMVDQFMNQSREPFLSYDEILIETVMIIFASYETTANAVKWTLFHLASNPHTQEKLYEELYNFDSSQDITIQYLDSFKYLDQCISESLRLRPPLAMASRQIEHSIVLDDFDIPKDTLVFISISAVHRDETIYPSPEVFDPDRFTPENRAKIPPGGYIPFGGGPRKCIGWKLALVESKILVAYIVKHFVISVENPEGIKVRNDVLTVSEKPIMFRFSLRS